jgi:hypothetical protein
VLEVEELQEKATQGRTEPYLCRLSDNQLYYIKGPQATTKGLINEAVCAYLGTAFDLNVPPYQTAYLPAQLLKYDDAARRILGDGDTVVFASRHLPSLLELTPSLQQTMPIQFAKDLFLFDYWIQNEDRTMSLTSGNPNLFLDAHSNNYVVVDHNLAFDPQYDFARHAPLHLSCHYWFHQQHDQLWRDYYHPKLEIALHGFAQYAASLPQEWLLAEPDYLAQITATLALFRTDEFWEALI